MRGICNGAADDWELPQAARWPAVEHDRRAFHGPKAFAEKMGEPGQSVVPTITTVE